MHTEIERKFLIAGEYKDRATYSEYFTQGYICASQESSVRVRIAGERAMLNIKGRSTADGLLRKEWEKEIDVDDAKDLMSICSGGVIEKIRHFIPYGEHTIEVDEFLGENLGLVVAEVEFACENDAAQFIAPVWFGEDVTGDVRYYNASLSKNPYRIWGDTTL